ncbi:MAG: hypothetical protein P4M11_04420 [Candidatus Pacebacteria bacterium]|nr:hypothetical protein [Candidatus Paceibacterota bacterium]
MGNRLKDILFPTLAVVIYNNERNMSILSREIDTGLIAEYLKNWLSMKEEEQDNLSLSGTSSAFDMLLGNSPFICISKRVPRKICEEVLKSCQAPTA